MPNPVPPVTSQTVYMRKVETFRGRSAIDYVLYAAPKSEDAVTRLREAAAFKAYMAESTGALQVGPKELQGIVRGAAVTGKLVVVHAEDPRQFTNVKVRSLEDHSAARPKAAESSALRWLASNRGEAKVHIAHVTCVEALDPVPPRVTCEVTTHHLFIVTSSTLGARGKENHPIP